MAILQERDLALCLRLMLVFFIISSIATSFAELQRFEHPPKDDGSLSFLVIGDWGRRGFYNQSIVAREVATFFYLYSFVKFFFFFFPIYGKFDYCTEKQWFCY